MNEMEPLMTAYVTFWLAVLGSVTGSFLDCAVWRLAEGEKVWKGRSHCGACGHVLGARDLIPVASFLLSRGKCRYCGAKIPGDCLAAEVLGAALFAGLGWRFGLSARLVFWLILGCILLALGLVDWRMRLLPDKLLLLAVVNRLLFLVILREPVGESCLSMLTGALSISVPMLLLVLFMDRLLKKESMGGGDIKLLFVLGLYMDWMQMLLLLFLGCLLALAAGLWIQKKKGKAEIPFGPFLGLAWFLVLLYGGPILDWYRSLL